MLLNPGIKGVDGMLLGGGGGGGGAPVSKPGIKGVEGTDPGGMGGGGGGGGPEKAFSLDTLSSEGVSGD
jgi:hypothetical protein